MNKQKTDPIHPGEALAEKLTEMKLHVSTLSKQTGIHSETLYSIIHGKHDITPEIADKLEKVTKVPVLFWLEQQWNFDLKHKLTLAIVFGKDQQHGVEKIIEEMGDEIRGYETEPDEKGVLYTISFKTEYSIYLFGYNTAHLMEYMMK